MSSGSFTEHEMKIEQLKKQFGLKSDKQAAFCLEYLVDLNATQAAIRAGYSKKTANESGPRLLVNVGIQAAIQFLFKERSERVEITQDYVLRMLKENLERAMQVVPALDKEGHEIGKFYYNGNVANKSLELLARHLGMFVEKKKIESIGKTEQKIILDFDNMSIHDFEKLSKFLDEVE